MKNKQKSKEDYLEKLSALKKKMIEQEHRESFFKLNTVTNPQKKDNGKTD